MARPWPVAFWIGHHPAVLLGTQAKLAYPQSHWEPAGGVLGEPLRLVPSITHGPAIMVPADAEIVIEGFAQPGSCSADAPFGEYTGYLGPQVSAPQEELTETGRVMGTIDYMAPEQAFNTKTVTLGPTSIRSAARCGDC